MKSTMPMQAGIQSGARTHHQDHVMTPVTFRTMKTMPSSPVKLIPAADALFDWCAILVPFGYLEGGVGVVVVDVGVWPLCAVLRAAGRGGAPWVRIRRVRALGELVGGCLVLFRDHAKELCACEFV